MNIPKFEGIEPGWSGRVINWILKGSSDEWTKKYRRLHYQKLGKKDPEEEEIKS